MSSFSLFLSLRVHGNVFIFPARWRTPHPSPYIRNQRIFQIVEGLGAGRLATATTLIQVGYFLS